MTASPNFATIFAFSAIAFSFAVTAAFLPSSGERKDIRDLRVEYGIEVKPSVYFGTGGRNTFDFLRFRLDPVRVEPYREITRTKQPLDKKIVMIEQPESLPIRSPQKFVVMVEDNTAVILEKLTSLVKQEREIHHRAIQIGSVEDCAAIESARAKADCRGEIYFQKAIIDNNFTLCDQIENEELLSRCQNYFQ